MSTTSSPIEFLANHTVYRNLALGWRANFRDADFAVLIRPDDRIAKNTGPNLFDLILMKPAQARAGKVDGRT